MTADPLRTNVLEIIKVLLCVFQADAPLCNCPADDQYHAFYEDFLSLSLPETECTKSCSFRKAHEEVYENADRKLTPSAARISSKKLKTH